MLVRLGAHDDILGLDPDNLAVNPRRHGIAKGLVPAPGVSRGLCQRFVDGAAVGEISSIVGLGSLMKTSRPPSAWYRTQMVRTAHRAAHRVAAGTERGSANGSPPRPGAIPGPSRSRIQSVAMCTPRLLACRIPHVAACRL